MVLQGGITGEGILAHNKDTLRTRGRYVCTVPYELKSGVILMISSISSIDMQGFGAIPLLVG